MKRSRDRSDVITHPASAPTAPPTASHPVPTERERVAVGGALPLARWQSRDGVRNVVAVECIEMEYCDHCTQPYAVDVLTPVIDEGLLCERCVDHLREELLTA